ncbi:MAG: transglutaminase domain-containing protein [Clostridiales bacterium]|nr:transglutaminase domain-containing protein [Clostridiales bacterium]
MKKKTIATTAVLTFAILLSSCTVSVKKTSSSDTSVTTTPVTMTTVPAPQNGGHEFNPHVLSDFFRQAYGPGFEQDFYSYCDAVLNAEDSVKLNDKANYSRCRLAVRMCLPVADTYISMIDTADEETKADEMDNKDGTHKLEYTVPKEEIPGLVEEFKARVKTLIDSCCMEDDTPLEKVFALYMEESTRLDYDWGAEEGTPETSRRLSVYHALMEDKGICQEIAGAYAYLLLQVDVDASTCSAMTHDFQYGHEWTVVKLGDKYYHCDITAQTQEKLTLRYFGMNDSKREKEGDYAPDTFNYGCINMIYHEDLPITDATYEPLWKAKFYEIDHEKNVLYCYESSGNDGKAYLELPL